MFFQRFAGRRLDDAKKRKNEQDNDDHADDVKNVAHEMSSSGFPVTSRALRRGEAAMHSFNRHGCQLLVLTLYAAFGSNQVPSIAVPVVFSFRITIHVPITIKALPKMSRRPGTSWKKTKP